MGTKFCDQTGNTTFSVLIPVLIHSSASLSTLSKTTAYGIWKWWNILNILVSFLFSCLFTISPISPLFSLYLSARPFRPQCLPGLSPFGLARRNHLTAPTRRNYRLLCTTCAASVSLRSALQESIVHLHTLLQQTSIAPQPSSTSCLHGGGAIWGELTCMGGGTKWRSYLFFPLLSSI